MKKYFLPLLLVAKCLFPQVEATESSLQAIPQVTQEAYTAFVTDLRAADRQWKNQEREEALCSYTTLLENSASPLFTILINFRKGILESQMDRKEDAINSLKLALEPILTFGDLNIDEKVSDEKTLGDYYTISLMRLINSPGSVRRCPNSVCLCPESSCPCPQTVCGTSSSEFACHCSKSVCLCPESGCPCSTTVCPR